jgi:hypothetical protein
MLGYDSFKVSQIPYYSIMTHIWCHRCRFHDYCMNDPRYILRVSSLILYYNIICFWRDEIYKNIDLGIYLYYNVYIDESFFFALVM